MRRTSWSLGAYRSKIFYKCWAGVSRHDTLIAGRAIGQRPAVYFCRESFVAELDHSRQAVKNFTPLRRQTVATRRFLLTSVKAS